MDLDDTFGKYLPELKADHPGHARMELRDMLTHQAGLKPYVPFYLRLMKDGKLKAGIASDSATEKHNVRVADGLYIPQAYRDSMLTWMLDTPLGKKGCLLYTSPSPRDRTRSRMPSSA